MIRSAILALALVATPAIAQEMAASPTANAETWRGAFDTIILPRTIAGYDLVEERPLTDDGTDTILQYRHEESGDAVTFYVYRASEPNAMLWFRQAMMAIAQRPNISGLVPADEMQMLRAGGSASPNAVSQSMRLNFDAFRTAGLTIVQLGEWIVKIRVSRPSEDVAAMTALLAELAAAISYEGEPFTAHPLVYPGACNDRTDFDGNPLSIVPAQRGIIVTEGLIEYSDARGGGGISVDPSAYCDMTPDDMRTYTSLFREREADHGGWTMLIADAGWSLVTRPLASTENGEFGLFANRPNGTYAIGLFDRAPAPGMAIGMAVPVFRLQNEGLGRISSYPNDEPAE
ncbi:hypothetical protein [Parasphingopyxis marina]|uniref:Uncharacterized protein n=1 Tax=Parasphingopyxis marina TaxID=2761622 RepID=A0A842HY12_9SPHN|nr:hypothetical protein [Parasphingopyxis marina]MBC2777745.1 hypothetical protein [Parasphingopyxis marina]